MFFFFIKIFLLNIFSQMYLRVYAVYLQMNDERKGNAIISKSQLKETKDMY